MSLERFLKTCPGHVGEIARSVDATLKVSRPSISLPAALAFCAALKCGRVVSQTGIEPNLYILSLAPPSFGKTQAQNALEDIAEAAEIEKLFAGVPTSDAGLISGLNNQPRQLLLWDEFGEALEDLAHAKNSPKATILSQIMIAFSSAGRIMRGKQYADGRTSIVDRPYLNLFAVSNEFSFFNSLTDRFVHNGFLARWLCFAPDKDKPWPRDRQQLFISPETLHWLQLVDAWTPSKNGNLGKLLKKEKKIVDLSKSITWASMSEGFDSLAEGSKTEFERVFWGRASELYTKLCLVFFDETIEEKDLNRESPSYWCFELVLQSVKAQIERCQEKIGGTSDKERARDRYMALLEKGEEVTKTELSERSRRIALSRHEKNELTDLMVESGRWKIEYRFTASETSRKTQFIKRIK